MRLSRKARTADEVSVPTSSTIIPSTAVPSGTPSVMSPSVVSSAFNSTEFTKGVLASNHDEPSPRAVIGSKIVLKGILTGSEDVLIEGQFEGRVELAEHDLTVGAKGIVCANTKAKSVTLEGRIKGNVEARELITITITSCVEGNLNAPRVRLDDGANYCGVIDMS